MYNDELYIGKRPSDTNRIDPNEKMPGEVSDDDAYVIQVNLDFFGMAWGYEQ